MGQNGRKVYGINMKSVAKLAKEHMRERKGMGFNKSLTDKRIPVKCNVCRRDMTVRDYENPPYYCYKCNEEAEACHQ
jgi:hypothetical protein